jgi:nucleoside-diphosphate-sugar epimerase
MSKQRKVLITGAGGFIGGRMVEVLHALDYGHIRAGLRRWSSGARVGRFPVELVKCDLRDAADVRAALQDVTHVVHCAVGDHASTVDGTRTLMEAALAAGVQRVIHISTIDVYGTPLGVIDETHPTESTGRAYGDMKLAAEQICQDLARRGLPVTILRPTLVHGPFSATWTVAYAQRLQARPWLIPEADASGTCNLVYVDDLVGAVIAALEADTAPGEVFNINGPDVPTWSEYFHALNDALGLPPLAAKSKARARLTALTWLPVRKLAKVAMSRFGSQVMAVYQRSELARTWMKKAEGKIRTTPVPDEFEVYRRKTSYSIDKARRLLGYQPRFPLKKAVTLSAGWLKHAGYVPNGAAQNGNHR